MLAATTLFLLLVFVVVLGFSLGPSLSTNSCKVITVNTADLGLLILLLRQLTLLSMLAVTTTVAAVLSLMILSCNIHATMVLILDISTVLATAVLLFAVLGV